MRAGMIIVLTLQGALLFDRAEQIHWPWAWGYFGISLRFLRSPNGLAAILLICAIYQQVRHGSPRHPYLMRRLYRAAWLAHL